VRVVGPSDYLTTIYIEGVKITTQLRKRICTHTHTQTLIHTHTNKHDPPMQDAMPIFCGKLR
jgi:hypothetical protein